MELGRPGRHPPPRAEHRARERRIGFLGRHSVDKGLVTLAAGLAELDRTEPGRYRLLLAGEGRFAPPEDSAPIRKAMQPVEHLVERPGWVSREDFFSSIDVAVFPSTWAEPFGLVVAEAMSSRTPFVITDAGALAEVAGPGHPWVAPGGMPSPSPRRSRRSSTPAPTGWSRCSTAPTTGGSSTSRRRRAWQGCQLLVEDLGLGG